MSERLILWHRWVPPQREDPERNVEVAAWLRSVATRFSVAGGAVLGTVGASVAASFDPSEVHDAIEMALDLLNEADGKVSIAIGVALGGVLESDEGMLGAVVERAQLLATRAKAGELLLDAGAREIAAQEFLFGRNVSLGRGAGRGSAIDRQHPRRSDSASAIASLGAAPLPPIVDSVRRQIESALANNEARTFVLRGPVGAGATEVIAELERSLEPTRVLNVGASPGGVVPLASLRLALQRRYGTPLKARQALAETPELDPAARVIARLTAGDLVPCDVLSASLARIVRAATGRAWVVLNPLGLVDGASLAAMLEARNLGADFVLFGRYPVEMALPRPLAELGEPVVELTLPPLKTADARVVAEAILGKDTSDDVARRVAVLGGDTVIGVVEAARTLIATGALVPREGGFAWREKPRAAQTTGTLELLSQRFDLLDLESRRVLEVLCVAPDGSPRELLATICARDGISDHSFSRSMGLLARDGLLAGNQHPRPASSLVRWRMLSRIPPSRSMELHRFVGEVLRLEGDAPAPLLAEIGYFLFEGGLESEARPFLTQAATAVLEAGYERAARQLTAWLAQRDQERRAESEGRPTPVPDLIELHEEGPPSSEMFLDELLMEEAVAKREPSLAPAIPPPRPTPSAGIIVDPPTEEIPPSAQDLDGDVDALLEEQPREEKRPSTRPIMQEAVKALRERDFTTLEAAMERAIAEGSDLGAVGRVRALAELARGDLDGARRSLREARMLGRDDPSAQARYRLAEALLELYAGDPMNGIRAALGALAASRKLADPKGEAAALHTLAGCYRALGRDAQASRLER